MPGPGINNVITVDELGLQDDGATIWPITSHSKTAPNSDAPRCGATLAISYSVARTATWGQYYPDPERLFPYVRTSSFHDRRGKSVEHEAA